MSINEKPNLAYFFKATAPGFEVRSISLLKCIAKSGIDESQVQKSSSFFHKLMLVIFVLDSAENSCLLIYLSKKWDVFVIDFEPFAAVP